MVEEEVEIEVVAGHLQVVLAADERETDAELEQEGAEMVEQAALEIPPGRDRTMVAGAWQGSS